MATLSNQVVTSPITRLDGKRLSAERVTRIVQDLMAKGKVPGLALAIINDSKVVFLNGFGMRNVARSLPVETETVMYAASLTKSAFATMCMQLVDEGVLRLDIPVERQLSKPIAEFPDHSDLANDPRFHFLTPRMLLCHTSGLPNVRWLKSDGTMDENAILKVEIEPGQRYAYSGEGINLLGTLVANLTGKTVGELMNERIFKRFGMTHSSMTWQPQFESNTAEGYAEDGTVLGHNRQKRPRAAGSMDTTVHDYANFLVGVMNSDGLTWASHEAMLSPQIRIKSKRQFPSLIEEKSTENDNIQLSYGLGWGIFHSPYGKAYFKGGHLDGWENYCVSFPEKKTAILILTNSSNGESIFKDLLEQLIADKYTPSNWENFIPYNAKPHF